MTSTLPHRNARTRLPLRTAFQIAAAGQGLFTAIELFGGEVVSLFEGETLSIKEGDRRIDRK